MNIQELVASYTSDAIALRRELHKKPELAFQEFETAATIRRELTAYGIEIQELPDQPTAVVGLIRGGKPGKTVSLRADIDALPMQELTGLPYASQSDGKAHACGHDIHTVAVLLAGRVLSQMREELCGNVRLYFQPAEEKGQGAMAMIQAGALALEPISDCVIGLHVSPEYPDGTLAYIHGTANASVDTLHLTVRGVGGHGAQPHRCVDPILTAAYLINQMQSVVSRENPPLQPAVLSFCSIHGGTAANIITPEVKIDGTLRAFDADVRKNMKAALHRIAKGVADSMRAEIEVEIEEGSPSIVNRSDLIDDILKAAEEVLGVDHVVPLPFPTSGSDDFADFVDRCPGAQFRMGTGLGTKESTIGLHNPNIVFGEKSISASALVMTQFVCNALT